MPKRKRSPTRVIDETFEDRPQDEYYYGGRVHHFNKFIRKFYVAYDYGSVEYLNLDDKQSSFSKWVMKKTSTVAHAPAAKRGRTTAAQPSKTEIPVEEAHQVVQKVVSKSIRRIGRSRSTLIPWYVIRMAENMLCSALTDTSVGLGTARAHVLDHESTLVMDQVKETILRASKNVTPSPVGYQKTKM